MKITKLNENQELADLLADKGTASYEKALKLSDAESKEIIDNLPDDQKAELNKKKEIDKYNQDEIEGDAANKLSLKETEKAFNKAKFEVSNKYQQACLDNLARNYSENMGLKTAGEVLKAYSPKFIKSWADSFNWQAVGDRNEPFVQAINNPGVKSVLVTGNKGDESR